MKTNPKRKRVELAVGVYGYPGPPKLIKPRPRKKKNPKRRRKARAASKSPKTVTVKKTVRTVSVMRSNPGGAFAVTVNGREVERHRTLKGAKRVAKRLATLHRAETSVREDYGTQGLYEVVAYFDGMSKKSNPKRRRKRRIARRTIRRVSSMRPPQKRRAQVKRRVSGCRYYGVNVGSKVRLLKAVGSAIKTLGTFTRKGLKAKCARLGVKAG